MKKINQFGLVYKYPCQNLHILHILINTSIPRSNLLLVESPSNTPLHEFIINYGISFFEYLPGTDKN